MFISALGAITGKDNRLGLPRVKSACVVMVDGLGSANLKFRAGHAPGLFSQLNTDGSISCGFPATTVSSLASFSTGARPGQHGMVGYQIFDSASRQNLNLLTGITSAEQAQKLQPIEPVSELAAKHGVTCYFIGPAEYEGSGFTLATMRGASYVAAKTIDDRFIAAQKILSNGTNHLVYLYIPELDQKAHSFGSKSGQWVEKLEDVESAIKRFIPKLPNSCGVLLTADHGIIDVAQENQVYLDEMEIPGLVSVGGDPRVLFLYLDENSLGASQNIQDFIGKRGYVATKDELVQAGWFGVVTDYALARLPQLFVIALGETAFYHREFAKLKSMQMIGQHGSISSDELQVPLLRYAGFAKK